jgi:uncharacterized protein YndB with AHSA1/START domain
MPQVTRSIHIPRSPNIVWKQFASENALRRWLAPTISIDLQEGGAYRIVDADGPTSISGVVRELVPESLLVLSWMEEGSEWRHPGRLVVALRAEGDGTEVTLTHDGFAGIGTSDWKATREAYDRGIDRHQLLQHLAAVVLEHG